MKFQARPVVVDAYKIMFVGEVRPHDGSRSLQIDTESREPYSAHSEYVTATAEMLARMTPVPGDYWVVQSDGYVYVNPHDVFLRKYEPVREPRRPPFETFKRPTCKGCFALGSACGACEKCQWEQQTLRVAI